MDYAIKNIQNDLLKEHLLYCKNNSPFYKKVLSKIDSSKISLGNLKDLPFTEKSDIETFNGDFLAVSEDKIVDIVLSSGTTGKPTKIMLTQRDLKRLAYNEEEALKIAGISSKDSVLLTCTMDRCFIAGLAYFLGLRNIGASVIRNGVATTDSHVEIIKSMKPTVIIGVPTFLKKLGLYLIDMGIKPKTKKLICIGEPLRDKNLTPYDMTEELEEIWKAKTYSTYASTEIATAFCECEEQKGGHLLPDLAVVEIVDDQGNLLPYGELGEVVITPLAVEGMPLIRFKTGDISFLIDEPCLCGRNSVRLGPIIGRKNQMMKVKGTTLYPQAIFSVLEEMDQVLDYFIEVTKESELSDKVQLFVSFNENANHDAVETVSDRLKARLRVKLQIQIIDKEKLISKVYQTKSRKPKRFFDKR